MAHDIAYKAVYEHFALQKVHELTLILSLIEEDDVVVEIGCDAGGTSWAIEQCNVTRFGIDLPGAKYSSGLTYAGNMSNMIFGDSHLPETKEKLTASWNHNIAEVDILIIDGDHSYTGVMQDFQMYNSLCKGITIFHDICHHPDPEVGVEEFWNTIKTGYGHFEYMTEPYDWGGLGILDMGKLKRRINALSYARSES